MTLSQAAAIGGGARPALAVDHIDVSTRRGEARFLHLETGLPIIDNFLRRIGCPERVRHVIHFIIVAPIGAEFVARCRSRCGTRQIRVPILGDKICRVRGGRLIALDEWRIVAIEQRIGREQMPRLKELNAQ